MADNYITNPGAGGVTFASDEDGGAVHYPLIKLAWGPLDTFNILADAAGKGLPVKIIEVGAVTLPVSGPLTDVQLRAVAVPVSGAFFQATQPVSIAAVVTVSVNNFPVTQPVSGTVSTKTDLAPAVPTNAVVGAASAQAVAANGARKGLHVRNTSTAGQRVSLSMNGAATLDDGITLYPQDVFEMGEYDFDQGAVNAIASGASARLSVQEFA